MDLETPLREGDLYVVRDGELVRLERTPDDNGSLRIRLHRDAAGALYRGRALYARHVDYRASLHEVVSAVVAYHADSMTVIAAMRRWIGRDQQSTQ